MHISQTVRSSFDGANKVLERFMFAVVLGSMAIGALFSRPLAVHKDAVPMLFAFMTFTTALGCTWRDFVRVFRTPAPILTCLLLLHVVHPLAAKGLGWAMHGASSPFTVALILGASVPVGVTSVIWSQMAGGDVPLSLAVVTLDTLLAPVVVPASVLLFAGKSVSFDATAMMAGLLKMIVLPTIAGVLLNDASRGWAGKKAKPYANPLSKISLGLVIAINVAAARGQFSSLGAAYPAILAGLAIQCAFGFISSHAAAGLTRSDAATSAAITFSAGMRNISAGVVIAMAYFEPRVAVPVVLSMLFQQPFATVTARLMRRFGRAPALGKAV